MGRRRKMVTVPVEMLGQTTETEDKEAVDLETYPLFSGFGGDEDLRDVMVIRIGPVEEGTVGKIEPTAGEDEIAARWGGGKYKLVGRNSHGKPVKGAFATREIAGDPILQSKVAKLQWQRMTGDDGGSKDKPAGVGVLDTLAILTRQEEKARSEWELRERASQLAHEREIARLRVEAELREKERREDREREEARRRADDERRERETREREERDRRLADERAARDKEFYAHMLKSQRDEHKAAPADPIASLMAGINLAIKLKGDGPSGDADPWTTMAQNLPDILRGAGELVRNKEAVRAEGQAPASKLPQRPAAAQPAAPAGNHPGELVIGGELGKHAEQVLAGLQAAGVDPARALAMALDGLTRPEVIEALRSKPAPAAAVAAPQAAPAPAPAVAAVPAPKAPAPPPAPKATTAPESATSGG